MAVVARAERFTPKNEKETIYQDWLVSSPFNFDTKDITLVTNEDSVKQSIINIILTSPGEKLFNNSFGSEINRLLFENVTPQTTASLIDLIKLTVENYEPRANLIDVVASPLPDQNAYTISIIFSVINNTEPITLEFLLNRVR